MVALKAPWAAGPGLVVVALATVGMLGSIAQDDIQLVTVVGCLRQDTGDLPWMLEKATAGTQTEAAFTSRDELDRSGAEALGSLTYRLLGVGEFGVEPHVGHKVQVKGLKLRYDDEWRLNVTSFQHLAPNCE